MVGDLLHELKIVGHEDHSHVALLLELPQQGYDLRLDGDIQRRRRLVCNEELGITRKCDRDHHTLAHTARQLMGVGIDPRFRIRDSNLS